MKILVTGSSGFLARNLKNSLTKEENELYYFVGRQEYNLADSAEMEFLFNKIQPTHIIHLAAMASARSNSTQFIDDNIKATYNLLNSAPKGIDFIFASSVLVYGHSEGCFYETDKCKPNSPYAVSKLCCENMVDMFGNQGKIRPRILRFPGIIGPGLKHGRIFEVLNGKRDIKLFGCYPGNYVPYITTEDAVKTIKKTVSYNKPSLKVNVTPENDTISIAKTLDILQEELGEKLNVTWDRSLIPNEHICCHANVMGYELGLEFISCSKRALQHGIRLIKEKNNEQENRNPIEIQS